MLEALLDALLPILETLLSALLETLLSALLDALLVLDEFGPLAFISSNSWEKPKNFFNNFGLFQLFAG